MYSLRTISIFTLLLYSFFWTACASEETNTPETTEDEPVPTTPVEVTPTNDIREFWPQFQAAVAQNDKDAIAAMTEFPLRGADYMKAEGGELGLTEPEFMNEYEQIFTEEVRQAIGNATVDDLKFMVATEGNNLTERARATPNGPIYSLYTQRTEQAGTDYEQFVRLGFVFTYRNDEYKWVYLLRV